MYRSRKKEDDTGVYLRWPAELHQQVKKVAEKQGVSMNQLIIGILEEHLYKVPVPLRVVERDGVVIYEISIPPDYFYEEEDD